LTASRAQRARLQFAAIRKIAALEPNAATIRGFSLKATWV
jgi:hypothetical protein